MPTLLKSRLSMSSRRSVAVRQPPSSVCTAGACGAASAPAGARAAAARRMSPQCCPDTPLQARQSFVSEVPPASQA